MNDVKCQNGTIDNEKRGGDDGGDEANAEMGSMWNNLFYLIFLIYSFPNKMIKLDVPSILKRTCTLTESESTRTAILQSSVIPGLCLKRPFFIKDGCKMVAITVEWSNKPA